MQRFFQKEIECMPREKLNTLQDERLVSQVRHVWENVPFYRKKMEEKGITPEDIKGVSDLHKLPFVTKADLRDAYPYGFLGTDKKECIRVHSTSGTTGKRVLAFYTKGDIDLWEDCCARALVAAGATNEDICQIAYGYGLFTGGMGINGASHKVGCMTIPMSSGNTERQLQFIKDLGTTVLCCTPSYAAYLGEAVKENKLEDKINLKIGIFGAEAWSEEMRRDIEKTLNIKAYDIYGLTELGGPGVAYECSQQNGMHINEDHFIAEIIDPETGENLPDGTAGELVFTSLTKKAFPLLRYRTKDICILSNDQCSCGRTHKKMCRPMGRNDDMLIVKGVNVFPSQIETVLFEEGYSSNYQIIVDRVNNTDTIEVLVEMTQQLFSDNLGEITEKEKSLVAALKTMLGIYVKVRLVLPQTIARSEGKSVRVIDKRKI